MKEIIQEHFKIHRTRFERASLEFGLDPWVSYVLIPILFIGMSFLLLSKDILTQWSYIIPPVFILFILSNPARLRFYKQIYSESTFKTIRTFENFIVAIPFLFFMLFKAVYLPFIVLFLATIYISIKNRNDWFSVALPTPFYRFPFEFTSGFRYSWILIIGLYILVIIAWSVNNEALGKVSVITLCLSSTLYYQNPESEYFIWIHNMDSSSFIQHKIKIALNYTLLLATLMLLLVILAWPSYALWTILGVLCALLFLATTIVAKYTMYPQIFNLPLVIALSLGFVAPPVLLILFPYLYNKAVKNLNPILS